MPLVLIDGAYGGNGRSALTKSEEDKKALALRKADNAFLVGFVSGISVGVKVLIREGFVVVLPLPPESKKQYCIIPSTVARHGLNRVRATVRCIDIRLQTLCWPLNKVVRGVLPASSSLSRVSPCRTPHKRSECRRHPLLCCFFHNTVQYSTVTG
jgi:hypothetical protein